MSPTSSATLTAGTARVGGGEEAEDRGRAPDKHFGSGPVASRPAQEEPVTNYQEAVAFLDRHVGLGIRPGLERMRGLLELMGNPQRGYPIIHITGTNGKTTTARLVTAILGAHGLVAGTFTSPHLQRVEERLGRNLETAALGDFARAISDVAAFVDLWVERGGDPLTYFELTTLAAYSWFAGEAVDAGVVEVGLGGRLDATNAADGAVAVLTGVAREHTNYLGDTLESIAKEKAAIAKPGSVMVTGPLPAEAQQVAAGRAAEVEALELRFERDFGLGDAQKAVGGWLCDIEGVHAEYQEVYLPLHGRHQTVNLAVAVAAAEALFGRALSLDALREGMTVVTSPGRLEVVRTGPLVVLDGAHNGQAFAALETTLGEEFAGRAWVLVLGMMGDKDRAAMVEELDSSRFAAVVTTAAEGARPVPPEEVSATLREVWGERIPVETAAGAKNAIERALELAGDQGSVLVTGSLYLVGEVRTALGLT